MPTKPAYVTPKVGVAWPYVIVRSCAVTVSAAFAIVKVRATGVAGSYVALPACDAVIVQLPALVSETNVPSMLHWPLAPKLIGRSDEAVALTVKAGSP